MRRHLITARDLRSVICGAAIMDANHVVVEGVPHHMARVLEYVRRAGFNERVPWCAAWVDYVVVLCASEWGVPDPLQAVRQVALVQAYYEWAERSQMLALPSAVEPGDLAFFRFGGSAHWNHIGIVTHPPLLDSEFGTVEGNTSPGVGATGDERERNGGGVWRKERRIGGAYPVAFAKLGV